MRMRVWFDTTQHWVTDVDLPDGVDLDELLEKSDDPLWIQAFEVDSSAAHIMKTKVIS